MGAITDISGKLKDAYDSAEASPIVSKVLDTYNTWRNTKSNIFSEDAEDLIKNSKLVPDSIKDRYGLIKDAAQTATNGLIGSSALTFGLRHQKIINKGIDIGVDAVRGAGKFVNNRIDDFVENMHEEKKARGYENIVKDEPSDEDVAFSY